MFLLLLPSHRLVSFAVFIVLFHVVSCARNIYVDKWFPRIKLDPNKTRFTAEEKLKILQIHNSYRSLVEPPARDMKELRWDDDLEQYSWNHTQLCTGNHSKARMVKVWNVGFEETWENMGENLYFALAPTYSIDNALHLFWIEGRYFNIKDGSCAPGKVCGHYQVLVDSGSSRVGCAINTCPTFSNSKYKTPSIFMSCTFNGAFIGGSKPYIVGPRGADCTPDMQLASFRYCRHGLCTSADFVFRKKGYDGDTSIVDMQPAGSPCGNNTRPTVATQPTTLGATTSLIPGFEVTGPTITNSSSSKDLESTTPGIPLTQQSTVKSTTPRKAVTQPSTVKSTTPREAVTQQSTVTMLWGQSNMQSNLSQSRFQLLPLVVCLLVMIITNFYPKVRL